MCRLSLCSTYHTFYLDLISPTKPRGCKSAATLPEWWVDAATSIARCMDMAICRFNGPDRVSPRKSRIMRVTLVLQPGVAYANCSRLRHHKLSCNFAGCNCQLCRFTITGRPTARYRYTFYSPIFYRALFLLKVIDSGCG